MAIDADQAHQRCANGVWPHGRAQGKCAHRFAIMFRALGQQIAAAAIQPIQHLYHRVGRQPVQRSGPNRVQHKAAFWPVVMPLAGAIGAVVPRGFDMPNKAQAGVIWRRKRHCLFVGAQICAGAHVRGLRLVAGPAYRAPRQRKRGRIAPFSPVLSQRRPIGPLALFGGKFDYRLHAA